MSKRGLGKGLDALLSTSSAARDKQQKIAHDQTLSTEGQLAELSIQQLKSGKYQPRKDIQADALEELSASIRSQGIIQPIVVRQVDEDKYEIIAGERRWRAAKLAGLTQVPCVIKNVQDRAAIAMALIENIQRENLNAIEEAQALERLQKEFELTHQQVADAIGKSRTAVTNLLRLNSLDDEVKQHVVEKTLEMGHARALLALENGEQSQLAQQVIGKKLTVRQTEALVKKYLEPKEVSEKEPDTIAERYSEQLSQHFGNKVSIRRNENGKGKITIDFDDMETVLALLDIKFDTD